MNHTHIASETRFASTTRNGTEVIETGWCTICRSEYRIVREAVAK